MFFFYLLIRVSLTDGDDFAGIYALSSNDIKVGTSIEVDGAPWRVLGIPSFFLLRNCMYVWSRLCDFKELVLWTEFLHVKPGKGAAFVRTKIRNYVNGSTVERTFRAGITVSEDNLLLLFPYLRSYLPHLIYFR